MTEPAAPGGSPWTDSAAGRLAGALVAPGATFRSLARRPTWVLALVVFTLVFIGTQLAVMSRVDPDVMRQAMVEQFEERGQEVSDEDLARIERFQRLGPACLVVFVPIVCLVIGLVLMVVANLLGGEVSFHGSMAVVTHALMPLVVASLLTVLVAFAGSGDIDPVEMQRTGGLLSSNLAFLAPEDASPSLVVMLASLDLFQVWTLVLMAYGLALAAGLSFGVAGAVVGVLWVLWVGALAALASLGSGAGGGG